MRRPTPACASISANSSASVHIYLPIAQLAANGYWLLLLGGITGVFAGMFGIGGGFILTPMLIFMGVPPAVAVATSTNMIVASSFSGFLTHLKRKRVDMHIGSYLILGGVAGVLLGVHIFSRLQRIGQVDLMITLLYTSLLLSVAAITVREALLLLKAKRSGASGYLGLSIPLPGWVGRLPLQRRFVHSDIQHSVMLPIAMGVISGLLVGLLGIGGGFITIPMMLYILRMPLSVTVGTSLFQIIFITALATVLHGVNTQAIDIVLAALLVVGSAIGAQYGVKLAQHVPTYLLRLMMAGLMVAIALRLAYGLFVTPDDMFTLTVLPS